jgi:hypothetical protein
MSADAIREMRRDDYVIVAGDNPFTDSLPEVIISHEQCINFVCFQLCTNPMSRQRGS